MNSFSLRNDDDASSQPPLHNKRRRIAISALVSTLVVIVSGILGMFVGYEYVYTDSSRASSEDNIIPECKDLDINMTSDIEGGLNAIIEWYPESAAELRANKNDIVQTIVSMASPPKDSPLRKLRLFGKKFFGGRRLVYTSQRSLENNEDNDDEDDDETMDSPDTEIAEPMNCSSAIASVLIETLNFVTGFIWRTRTRGKLQFGVELMDWLQKNYDVKQLEALTTQAKKIALAKGAAAKAKVVWEITRQAWKSGGGWLKLYLDWMVANSRSAPWVVVKRCVKIAAQLFVWFGGGLSKFMGVMTFQIVTANKIVNAADQVRRLCQEEVRDSGALE